MSRNFREMLEKKWSEGKFVCVGLDTDPYKVPVSMRLGNASSTIIAFNEKIVEATKDLVCVYKPNTAFYEAYGDEGMFALSTTIEWIHRTAPEVPVILDAKRADIGNTNGGYVEMAFEWLKADAITVHPYLGAEALQPILDQKDKGIFVLCRTSNKGAGEFQDVRVDIDQQYQADINSRLAQGSVAVYPVMLYQYLAAHVADYWNKNGNCGVVVGATYPEELAQVRRIVGDMPILIPGIGAQGGDLEQTVKAGKDSRGQGMIINSSRGIIFASSGPDFAEAARRETQKLHDLINRYRNS